MAHILRRLGEAAFMFRKAGEKTLPPIISRRQAAELRKQFETELKPWPYSAVFPGAAKNDPPYNNMHQKGRKQRLLQHQREKDIERKMAEMPSLVAEYRSSQHVKWEDVPLVDKILLSRRQIRDKYLAKAKQRR